MDKLQKELWDRVINEWDNNNLIHLQLTKKYTIEYPDDMYGWIILADILSKIAIYDKALAALKKSMKLCPEDKKDQIYDQMGHHYSEKCNLKIAEKWYRKSIEHKVSQESLIFLGACLAKQGRFIEAKEYHQKAVKKKPKTADEAYFNLGLIFKAEGNYKKALSCFNKAIKIDPGYEDAIFEKSEVLEYLEFAKNGKYKL